MNVVGPLTLERFNPANNVVRFLIFVSLPALLLALAALLRLGRLNTILFDRPSAAPARERAPRWLNRALFAATVLFFGLVSLSVPTYHASGTFDTFHEGESLGTSVSLDHGMVPYRDFIFLHGLYQDPYRSSIAFRLFGRSIGAGRTLESMHKVLNWMLLAALVVFLFEMDYIIAIPVLVLLALLQRDFSTFFYRHLIDKSFVCYPESLLIIPPRDTVLLIVLASMVALLRLGKQESPNAFAVGAAGFVLAFTALGAFALSVDRGFYLGAVFVFAAPIAYWLYFRRGSAKWVFPLSIAWGGGAAIALLAVMLKGHVGPFITFVFNVMPRYKELSDGHVFTIAFLPYLRVSLLFAFAVLWVSGRLFAEIHATRSIVRGTENFLRRYFLEFHLLLMAVFFFRSALGRTDWEHIIYSVLPLYLLIFIIAGKHFLSPVRLYLGFGRWMLIMVLTSLVLGSAYLAYDARRSHLADANFPFKNTDEQFLGPQYRDALDYLESNLGPEDSVLPLTSEASWYYLLDRPAPTRFPVVWFATPEQFQREIVDDLRHSSVKFVIYKSAYPCIDEISHEVRYPVLMEFINAHFRPDRAFGRVEIWVRDG